MTEFELSRLFPYSGTATCREVKGLCEDVVLLLAGAEPEASISHLEETELLGALRMGEQICAAIRHSLTRKLTVPEPEHCYRFRDAEKAMSYLPIRILWKDSILTVRCPPTFLRNQAESWALSDAVKAALQQFVEQNGKPEIPQPAYVICRRKASRYLQGYRDNENYESSRIINAVMDVLGYTDRPDHLGYVSLFTLVPDPAVSGVDFVFLTKDLLPEHPELIDF